MTEALTRARPQIDDPTELDRVVQRLVGPFDPVAIPKRPRKGDQIGAFAKRLRSSFPARARFLALDRFPNYVWAPRHPGEEADLPPPPVPSVTEAHAWIAEVEALKTDFERWLAGRETRS
jgi:hypothetical protein